MRKRTGPRTLPWGIPLLTSTQSEQEDPTRTCCCLLNRKYSVHFRIRPVIPYASILASNRWCGTVSKALAKSKYIQSTFPPHSKVSDHSSSTSRSCVTHECFCLNQCWCTEKIFFSSMCFIISSLMKDSILLHRITVKLTGR